MRHPCYISLPLRILGGYFMGFAQTVDKIYKSPRFNIAAFILIAGMVVISYSNTFYATFHFDDNPAIVENPTIKRVTWENISSLIQGSRPTVNLSLMLNYQLNGLNVVGWHIFNISVHIFNSCFVYLLALWTLNLPALGDQYRERSKRMALFAALLFAVHPIQTESVTYIITRTELLATFFYLATFLFFIKGAKTNKFGYSLAAFFTAALSMGAKEWAVTLPAMLLIYDYLFLAQGKVSTVLSRWKTYILVTVPWVIIFRNLNLSSSGGSASVGFAVSSQTGLNAQTYFLTSFNVIWTYIRLLFLPINQNLDYDYPVAKTLFEFPTILSFLGHVAVVGASFWVYKKKGWLLVPFGLAWFYIGLSPVQSFVPIIDVIFEHRLYMPSIGFFIAFVVMYEKVFEVLEEKKNVKTVGKAQKA